MSRLVPVSRRELIVKLNQLGFQGPFPRAKHAIMQRGDVTVMLPNPHRGDISVGLLTRLLRQAGIDRAVWEKL